jgi:hypothetical protein
VVARRLPLQDRAAALANSRVLRGGPLLSAPNTADALLFDLGRVVLDIDFLRAGIKPEKI